MIFFGETMLRNSIVHYLAQFQSERNHQGLDNAIPESGEEVAPWPARSTAKKRVSGLQNYHHHKAA